MTFQPVQIAHEFIGAIGVDVQGETWSCVEVPGSAELFGTRSAVRCDVVLDGLELPNAGLMITGRGGHMVSLSAKVRKTLGKEVGDVVTVRVVRRVK